MFNDACQDQLLSYFKYVDDLTLLENRTLQKQSILQHVLDYLLEWTENNHMKLNPKKMHCNENYIYGKSSYTWDSEYWWFTVVICSNFYNYGSLHPKKIEMGHSHKWSSKKVQ